MHEEGAQSHGKGRFLKKWSCSPRKCRPGSGVLGDSRRCLDLGKETDRDIELERKKGKME